MTNYTSILARSISIDNMGDKLLLNSGTKFQHNDDVATSPTQPKAKKKERNATYVNLLLNLLRSFTLLTAMLPSKTQKSCNV